MKFEELKALGKGDELVEQIRSHAEVLRAQLSSTVDRAEHYLLFTNGGATVALMSFMAASERIRALPAAWHALMWFNAGVILCGVVCAANYQFRLHLFRRWLADSEKFLGADLDHMVLFGAAQQLANSALGKLPAFAGYAAFGCFVVGSIIAMRNLIPG